MEQRKFNKMNFTSTKLMLPLFMLKRETLRKTQIDKVKQYIQRKSPQYTSQCQRENAELYETATIRHLRHVAGLDRASQPAVRKDCPKGLSPYNRETYKIKSFHLPPNLYDSTRIPYKSRMGTNCVKWTLPAPKVKRVQQPIRVLQGKTRKEKVKKLFGSYDLNIEIPKERKRCQLDINARTLKPCTRGMCLNQPDLCSPGPAYYDLFDKDCSKACRVMRKENRKNYNYATTYKFLRRTSVPETETFLNKLLKNVSFRSGPGRYETRYPCSCMHWHNRIFEPNLHTIVAQQKHLKFLGLPYTKIDQRRYYTPEYQNIPGHGHTYLFKVKKSDYTPKKESKRKDEPPDGPFVQRILNPRRRPLYTSTVKVSPRPPKVEFNCIMKITKRKAAKARKIGFSSTQPRFKDDEPPKIAVSMDQAGLRGISPEKRIRNYPITNTPISQIKGKLLEERHHHQKVVGVRKKPFQFANIPGVKILVQPADFRPIVRPEDGYYFHSLKPEDYFSKTSTESFIAYPSIYDVEN